MGELSEGLSFETAEIDTQQVHFFVAEKRVSDAEFLHLTCGKPSGGGAEART